MTMFIQYTAHRTSRRYPRDGTKFKSDSVILVQNRNAIPKGQFNRLEDVHFIRHRPNLPILVVAPSKKSATFCESQHCVAP